MFTLLVEAVVVSIMVVVLEEKAAAEMAVIVLQGQLVLQIQAVAVLVAIRVPPRVVQDALL